MTTTPTSHIVEGKSELTALQGLAKMLDLLKATNPTIFEAKIEAKIESIESKMDIQTPSRRESPLISERTHSLSSLASPDTHQMETVTVESVQTNPSMTTSHLRNVLPVGRDFRGQYQEQYKEQYKERHHERYQQQTQELDHERYQWQQQMGLHDRKKLYETAVLCKNWTLEQMLTLLNPDYISLVIQTVAPRGVSQGLASHLQQSQPLPVPSVPSVLPVPPVQHVQHVQHVQQAVETRENISVPGPVRGSGDTYPSASDLQQWNGTRGNHGNYNDHYDEHDQQSSRDMFLDNYSPHLYQERPPIRIGFEPYHTRPGRDTNGDATRVATRVATREASREANRDEETSREDTDSHSNKSYRKMSKTHGWRRAKKNRNWQ
jgi:hypothetical protein